MDPQAALNYARKAASDILDDMDHERATDPDDVQRLAESFQALDGWLSKDGFLPSDWQSDDEKTHPGLNDRILSAVAEWSDDEFALAFGFSRDEDSDERVLRCRDCEHPLHQMAEKALSGETAVVWADQHDVWVCDETGNEHRPGVTS
jgi:hypothetical protein